MAPRLSHTGPLILLSPAKTLNFESRLSTALAAITATQPTMLAKAEVLTSELRKQSKAQIKSLMGLSDALATLNHARFQSFEEQTARAALGAFEGAAYKGLDAATLDAEELEYLQGSLRILCGLYGVLRPYDEIRPYRLEMSTKLACGGHPHLYGASRGSNSRRLSTSPATSLTLVAPSIPAGFWGSALTDHLNAELAGLPASRFVLNVASQEYAKSVQLSKLHAPVITASFPGPAVHAKQARGEMVRFCAERRVSDPSQLTAFCGTSGQWRFVAEASTDSNLVFHRGAAAEASTQGKPKQPRAKASAEEPPASKRRK